MTNISNTYFTNNKGLGVKEQMAKQKQIQATQSWYEPALPLSQMNAAIEAQEKFYVLEESTHMGEQAISVRRLMEEGHELNQVIEKSRTRYKIQNEFIPPRIIRQLEKRGLIKLGG